MSTESQAEKPPSRNWTEPRRSERLARVLVSGLGAGKLPVAPGTWGSAEAVIVMALINAVMPSWDRVAAGALILILLGPGVVLSARVARAHDHPDPSLIVIDEILGQLICLLWVPVSARSLLAGFILFRFFDIFKPFPVRRCERLPGGWGIVGDDLIAGLYAGASLGAFHHLGWLG